MSARECLYCENCGADVCPQCGKSHMAERILGYDIEPGKVRPSVEGEIVQEYDAGFYDGMWWVPKTLCMFRVPGPGRYRLIVQKVGE